MHKKIYTISLDLCTKHQFFCFKVVCIALKDNIKIALVIIFTKQNSIKA